MPKDFTDDLDLGPDDQETPVPSVQSQAKKPATLREQRRAEKRGAKRKPHTFTVPEDLLDELREYVLRAKLRGEKVSASEVVTQGIQMYLKKYRKKHE